MRQMLGFKILLTVFKERLRLKRSFNACFILQQPRFVVRERIEQTDKAFLVWDFTFLWQGKAMHIHGGTLLHFAPDGRVVNHRDYWDAAGELYEKIPLLGALLRRIKRHMA